MGGWLLLLNGSMWDSSGGGTVLYLDYGSSHTHPYVPHTALNPHITPKHTKSVHAKLAKTE